MSDLSVEIAGIRMQNPIMNAAGTLDIEPEGARQLLQIENLGAFVQKSITPEPREGNNQPRIYEVNAGIINRIGLQNVGIREFVEKKLSVICKLLSAQVPLIVSVAAESIEGFVETAVILEENSKGRITAVEVNISCPNIEKGLVFGTDADLTYELIVRLKSKIILPLIVKLTPNVTDICSIAKVVALAGADAISLINTLRAAAYIERGPSAGHWIEGGFSGPVIKPVALFLVRQVAKVTDLPLIAMGGISNLEDALDFLRIKNVCAVAIGTASFPDPSIIAKTVDRLRLYMEEKGYSNIADLKVKEAR
ncbi:MAG: dihydroorotate dehydrogenase [Candidatus Nealsonbacteria bacterium]